MTVSNQEMIIASYAITRSNDAFLAALQMSKCNELVYRLRNGIVHGFFTKKDGSIRALVQVRGDSVNYQLVAQGLAWVDRQSCKAIFCRRWYIQEHQAVQERRGIWRLNLGTPPWQWGR